MAAKGKKRKRRATKIKYVVSIPGPVPTDLGQKISDAHARALRAEQLRAPVDHMKEKLSDAN
jgi:hypothetical protein